MESVIHYVRARNVAVLDCESIQTSAQHQCIRNLFILCKDGVTCKYKDFYACKRYRELETKYQRAFRYCQRRVHHLQYEPRKSDSPSCAHATYFLQNFIRENRIDLVLYKGGIVEKRLCNDAGVSALNIETLGAPKVKSHDPRIEVRAHYNFLINIGCM